MKSLVNSIICTLAILTFSISSVEAAIDLHQKQNNKNQFQLRLFRIKALPAPRSYELMMSESEKQDLQYILNAFANDTMLSIGWNKKTLEQAAARIAHIHPLRVLIEMLSDYDNFVNLLKTRQRPNLWNTISIQYAEALEEENNHDNVMSHITDFCSQLNIDHSYIFPYVDTANWEQLFDVLLDAFSV